MCEAYGWSSSSQSELSGQDVVRVGVIVGDRVVLPRQGTSPGAETQAGLSGLAYTQS